MPEQQLVTRLLELNNVEFRTVVDSETRSRLTPAVEQLIEPHLLPPAPTGAYAKRERDPRVFALAEALADPAVVERWFIDLTAIKRNVEGQIASKKAELLAKRTAPNYATLTDEYNLWRAGVLRFINAIGDRIVDARKILNLHLVTERARQIETDRDKLGFQVDSLRKAIARHKAATEKNFADVTTADTDLWKWIA